MLGPVMIIVLRPLACGQSKNITGAYVAKKKTKQNFLRLIWCRLAHTEFRPLATDRRSDACLPQSQSCTHP